MADLGKHGLCFAFFVKLGFGTTPSPREKRAGRNGPADSLRDAGSTAFRLPLSIKRAASLAVGKESLRNLRRKTAFFPPAGRSRGRNLIIIVASAFAFSFWSRLWSRLQFLCRGFWLKRRFVSNRRESFFQVGQFRSTKRLIVRIVFVNPPQLSRAEPSTCNEEGQKNETVASSNAQPYE